MELRGHITVYFSLLLVVIFTLLSMTIESARLTGVKIRCETAAFLGLESVFADYSIPLLKDYGLLFLDKSYGTEEEEQVLGYLKKYINCQAKPNEGLLVRGSDFYPVSLESVEITKNRLAAEEGGRVLEDEILNYMSYAAPAGLVEWVMERMGLLEQAEVVTDIFDRLADLESQAVKVDKAIQSMHRGMAQIKEFQFDMEARADRIKDALEELEEVYEDYDNAKTDKARERHQKAINSLKRSISLQLDELIQSQNTLLSYTDYVLNQKTVYSENTDIVRNKLTDMEAVFSEGQGLLEPEIREALEQELDAIRLYSAGIGDYYQVEPGTADLYGNQRILDENVRQLTSYTHGGYDGLMGVLDSCVENMKAYKTENLHLNYEDTYIEKSGVNIIEQIKKMLAHGILGLVMEHPEDISEKKFVPEESYKEGVLKESAALEERNLMETILVNEYLLKKFSTMLKSQKENVLDYEVEYILKGHSEDMRNLAGVAEELLAIRTGMNLIFLLGSQEKRTEAELLALALVGYTGMHGIVKVTQLLILTAWASAEGILDVRELFSGNRVPMLKDVNSWRLSMEGLLQMKTGNIKSSSSALKGLGYEDYLRLLLLKESGSNKNYRMMDLIEGNLREKWDDTFRLSWCASEMEIQAVFQAEGIFFSLPFMKEYKREEDGYRIEGKSAYSY